MQHIALFTLVAAVVGTTAQATTGVVPLPTQLQVADAAPEARPIVLAAARRAAPMPPPARRADSDRPTAPRTTGREVNRAPSGTAPPRPRPPGVRAEPPSLLSAGLRRPLPSCGAARFGIRPRDGCAGAHGRRCVVAAPRSRQGTT